VRVSCVTLFLFQISYFSLSGTLHWEADCIYKQHVRKDLIMPSKILFFKRATKGHVCSSQAAVTKIENYSIETLHCRMDHSVIIWFDNFYLVAYRKSRMPPAEHVTGSRPQIVAPIIVDGERQWCYFGQFSLSIYYFSVFSLFLVYFSFFWSLTFRKFKCGGFFSRLL